MASLEIVQYLINVKDYWYFYSWLMMWFKKYISVNKYELKIGNWTILMLVNQYDLVLLTKKYEKFGL